jgi:hypothetical protein
VPGVALGRAGPSGRGAADFDMPGA